MPTAPKNITIEFIAKDVNLKQTIDSISSAQQNLNKTSKKTAKIQQESQEKIKLNQREFKLLTKALKDAGQAMGEVGLKEQTLIKAEEGNAQALAKVRRAVSLNIKEMKRSAGMQDASAIAAKKHAKAQKLLAVTVDLNKKQLRKISAELKKAGGSFKKAGVSADTLKQAMRGNAKAMSLVSKSSKMLVKNLKGVNMGLFSITTNGRLLSNSFATARSKMLLFSFAAGLVSKALVGQVKKFGIQQESVQRLASVYGGEGAEALAAYASELQSVTTFGDESINAAMAQMGAFGATTEQTKTLTKATLDLSAGMGIDLNTASLLVAKSFGTSTNALGRYGVELDSNMTKQEKVAAITAKVEERYGGLAKQLASTTSGQLKQANNALGDMAEVFGRAIAPMVLVAAKALKSFAEAIDIKVMRFFVVSLTVIGATFAAIAVSSKVAAAGQAIYSAALVATTAATAALTAGSFTLRAALISTGVGALVVGLGALVAVTMNVVAKYDEANFVLDETTGKMRRLTEEEIKLRQAQADGEKALMKKIALLQASTDAERAAIEAGRKLSEVEISLAEELRVLTEAKAEEENFTRRVEASYNSLIDTKIAKLEADLLELDNLNMLGIQNDKLEAHYIKVTESIAKLKKERDEGTESMTKEQSAIASSEKSLTKQRAALEKRLELDKDLSDGLAALNEEEKVRLEFGDAVTDLQLQEAQAIDTINQKIKEQLELKEVQNEMRDFAMEQLTASADHEISEAQRIANEKIAAINKEESQKLDALRNTWLYKKMTDKQKAAEEKKITDDAAQQRKEAKKEANEEMKKAFKFKQQLDIIETIMATKTAVMKTLAAGAGFFSTPQAMWVAAFGAMQVAAIASQKPPKMQYGGLVGGNSHSQGGTMIEAERGEFVVSRAGVQATGMETLNRINAGGLGGGGGASIIINNPILGKDTIEDEIVPQIQEALRRGLSI